MTTARALRARPGVGRLPRASARCSCALYVARPAAEGQRPADEPDRALAGGRDPRRHPLHRPASKLPWLLLAAGSALFWLGDLYTYSYPHLLGADVPFPSPGDALYVAMYPVMMAGLLLLVRRRNAGTRPQRPDRRPDPHRRALAAGVDRVDGAVPAHGRPVARSARSSRSRTRSATSSSSAPSCASRSTPAAASPRSTCSRAASCCCWSPTSRTGC